MYKRQALVLADVLALVDALVLAEVLALVEALVDALVLADVPVSYTHLCVLLCIGIFIVIFLSATAPAMLIITLYAVKMINEV